VVVELCVSSNVIASEHAYDRWKEYGGRIYILDAFAKATYIGNDFHKSQEAEYYIWEDKIFVYAYQTNIIITVINVNYNLSSEINKVVINKQTKLVLKLLEKVDVAKARLALNERESTRKLSYIEDQILVHERKIEALRHSRNAIHEEVSRYKKETEAAIKDHSSELSRLYFSIDYRVKNKK